MRVSWDLSCRLMRGRLARTITRIDDNDANHGLASSASYVRNMEKELITYNAFYNLRHDPFEVTPDPAFCVPTPLYEKATATLYHGIVRQKGFLVMTGEAGTGKTLLLRCLLKLLREAGVNYSYVFNTRISGMDLLRYIAEDLQLSKNGHSKGELITEILTFLVGCYRKHTITVVIIDEAQDLSHEALEEVRLLSNFETNTKKLMQIVLVGQPELDTKLDSFELRQLKQRIAVRAELRPFDFYGTSAYVLHRLIAAGRSADSERLFPEASLQAIHQWAKGIPRMINTLCDNSLTKAFERGSTIVTREIVNQVAYDLRYHISDRKDKTEECVDCSRDESVADAARTLLRWHESLTTPARGDLSEFVPQAKV